MTKRMCNQRENTFIKARHDRYDRRLQAICWYLCYWPGYKYHLSGNYSHLQSQRSQEAFRLESDVRSEMEEDSNSESWLSDQSEHRRWGRIWVKDMTQTCPCDWAPEILGADGRNFQEGKSHPRTPLGRQIVSSQTSESSSKVCRNTPEGPWQCEKHIFLIWWAQDWSIWMQFEVSPSTKHHQPSSIPTERHRGGGGQDRQMQTWSGASEPQTGLKVHLPAMQCFPTKEWAQGVNSEFWPEPSQTSLESHDNGCPQCLSTAGASAKDQRPGAVSEYRLVLFFYIYCSTRLQHNKRRQRGADFTAVFSTIFVSVDGTSKSTVNSAAPERWGALR